MSIKVNEKEVFAIHLEDKDIQKVYWNEKILWELKNSSGIVPIFPSENIYVSYDSSEADKLTFKSGTSLISKMLPATNSPGTSLALIPRNTKADTNYAEYKLWLNGNAMYFNNIDSPATIGECSMLCNKINSIYLSSGSTAHYIFIPLQLDSSVTTRYLTIFGNSNLMYDIEAKSFICVTQYLEFVKAVKLGNFNDSTIDITEPTVAVFKTKSGIPMKSIGSEYSKLPAAYSPWQGFRGFIGEITSVRKEMTEDEINSAIQYLTNKWFIKEEA